MSLFVPSMCLLLAAEIALFIDDSHFEALIMVALTSNLVMYTLHCAIQEKLPDDSSLKLIDIWLVHGLVMPMVVFVILAINELLSSKSPSQTVKVANSFVTKSAANAEDRAVHNGKLHLCMFVCKISIPIISSVFVITFFIICFTAKQ